ncbi:PAS domain-containing protein [Marinimicrobium sp. ABcell2]|uniref:PAS domain-containing protein n=1 Tax=Marinimicrobium sp. ABcell2 TaxID=3069751 RepID=UPI0027B6C785|nr:PAS domain-containing protein [Marinimicrobium sp. ABcell2]MDQ2075131.1 PAS domain-containing protein [Marinimicrobium sp. ABcell2]
MPATIDESSVYIKLRDKAEALLLAGTAPATGYWSINVDTLRLLHGLSSDPNRADDALKLLHELQVHQVELDLQNEEIAANEQALVEDLDLYRTLYDAAPFGYCLVDLEGNVIQSNLAATELFGVGPKDIEGHSLGTFLATESRARVLALLQDVAQSGAKKSCLAEISGGSRHIQFMASLPAGHEHILLACCEYANAENPC